MNKTGLALLEVWDLKKSHEYFKRALDLLKDKNDQYLVRTLQNLGYWHFNQLQYSKANEYVEEAFKVLRGIVSNEIWENDINVGKNYFL